MTANQIAYWTLQESVRHNTVSESETHRHNYAGEQLATKQHNLNVKQFKETKRHNKKSEGITLKQLAETKRHNKVGERLDRKELQIKRGTLNESKRHNKAYERETFRHNKATEVETKRHNVAGEKATVSSLKETERHNKATEGITLSQLAEQKRHNIVTEGQGSVGLSIQQQNADTNSKNASTNKANAQVNFMNALTKRMDTKVSAYMAETGRINSVTEQEKLKHQIMNDTFKIYLQYTDLERKEAELEWNKQKFAIEEIIDLFVQGKKSQTDMVETILRFLPIA